MGSSPNMEGREDKEARFQLKPCMYRLAKHCNYLFHCIVQADSATFESLLLGTPVLRAWAIDVLSTAVKVQMLKT